MDQTKTDTPDILVAFETSMIEVEILAKKPQKAGVNSCILTHFLFRTKPEMNYAQEYQKGPLHVGRVQMTFRAYAWTDKEVLAYKKMREQEDLQLLGLVDSSVKAALDSLGDELLRYLEEAGEEFTPKEKTLSKRQSSALSPYTSVFKGFADIFSSFKTKKTIIKLKPSKKDLFQISMAKSDAMKKAKDSMWGIYHHFKKHHGMLNW